MYGQAYEAGSFRARSQNAAGVPTNDALWRLDQAVGISFGNVPDASCRRPRPYGKITPNPHVVHLWLTGVAPISHVFPHVMKIFHMSDTCEVDQIHADIMCPICHPHKPTCEAHVGSYLLALRSHVSRTFEIGTTHKSTCEFHVIFP